MTLKIFFCYFSGDASCHIYIFSEMAPEPLNSGTRKDLQRSGITSSPSTGVRAVQAFWISEGNIYLFKVINISN